MGSQSGKLVLTKARKVFPSAWAVGKAHTHSGLNQDRQNSCRQMGEKEP